MARRIFAEAIVLISVAFLAYYNSLSGGFHFDDQVLLLKEPFVTQGPTLAQIMDYKMGRPVTLLSFRLNYLIGRGNPYSYHAFNVANHALNAVLVFLFLCLIFKAAARNGEEFKPVVPFVGALLFAAHPIHTQTVNYVWARASLLATSFFLLSLMAYIQGAQAKSRSYGFFALSVIFYVLGLGSKPIAITVPAMALIYDAAFIARFDWKKLKGRWVVYALYALIAVGIAAKVLSIFARKRIGIGFAVEDLSPLTFFYTQLNVIVKYIALLLYPVDLNLEYDFPLATSLLSPATFFSLLLHAGLVLYALRHIKVKPLVAFSILWFYVTLAPSSSFVPVVDVIFEHHTYLPSIGFFLLVAVLFARVLEGGKVPRPSAARFAVAAMIITPLTLAAVYATLKRNQVWKDEVTLWTDVVRKSPNKPRPHNNLGHALFTQGAIGPAVAEYEKALAINPAYVDAILNLSICYLQLKQYDKAAALIARNLAFKPDDSLAYYNLGLLYQEQSRYDQAAAAYQKATALDPTLKEAFINLGIIHLAQGRVADALEQFHRARRLDPGDPLAHYNLGVAYVRQGEAGKAAESFKRAIQFKPDFYEARNDLGVFYLESGNIDRAIPELSRAVQINPTRAQAYVNLGLCYAQLGLYDDAINVYEKGLGVDGASAALHYHLAHAYRLRGELSRAREEFGKALTINPAYERARADLQEVGQELKEVP